MFNNDLTFFYKIKSSIYQNENRKVGITILLWFTYDYISYTTVIFTHVHFEESI